MTENGARRAQHWRHAHGFFDQLLDALWLSDLGVGRSELSLRWRRRRNLAQARKAPMSDAQKGSAPSRDARPSQQLAAGVDQ